MDGWRQCQRAHRFASSLARSLARPPACQPAHQLVFPHLPIHIAQSLMTAAAGAGPGHGEQSKWLPQPPPRGLFRSGWMDGSWPRPAVRVRSSSE